MPSTKTKIPQSISGFTVLPLTLPAIKSLPTSTPTTHFLYIRPHAPSNPSATTEQSLFISNLPIDATETSIRTLFAEQLGGSRVASVEFDSSVPAAQVVKRWKTENSGENRGKKRKRDEDVVAEGVLEDEQSALPKTWDKELRRSGGCAVVVFVDRPSAQGAMKAVERAARKGIELKWAGEDALGLQRYKTHHTLTFPSRDALQASINAYLTQFNRTELARNRIRSKQRSVPDEDGFVTVVRGGRAGPARLEEAEAKKQELEERQKKKGAKEDFYRFQVREKRKEKENELKRNFEEDRRRVQEMRARRGKLVPQS
jgi:ribosomal RNA-processing protein 7